MPFVLTLRQAQDRVSEMAYRSMNGRHGFEPAILFALLYIRANGFLKMTSRKLPR